MLTIKRPHSVLIAVLGVSITVVAFASPASAAPYTNQPTISVSNQSPTAGSHVTVCGTDFHAHTRVSIRLDGHRRLDSVRTDSSGSFCDTVRLPRRAQGAHTIVARDRRGDSASVSIQIARRHRRGTDATGASASLGTPIRASAASYSTGAAGSAVDGATAIGIVGLVGMLLLGGAVMLFTGRRRKVVS
jgi:hypothetical protein